MHGRCELCEAADQDLKMFFIGDFAGWACKACITDLRDCQERRFCGTVEESEPAE